MDFKNVAETKLVKIQGGWSGSAQAKKEDDDTSLNLFGLGGFCDRKGSSDFEFSSKISHWTNGIVLQQSGD